MYVLLKMDGYKMVQPAKNDLVIYCGATFIKTWTWKADDVPVDLTGCTLRSQVRQQTNSCTVLIDMTTENGMIVLKDAENGTFQMRIEANDTAQLKFLEGVYDLEIVFPDETVVRLLYGKVTLSREVTR